MIHQEPLTFGARRRDFARDLLSGRDEDVVVEVREDDASGFAGADDLSWGSADCFPRREVP